MSDINTQPRWLNAEQVAARYGCGRVTVYRMVKRGQIPAPIQFSGRMSRWDINGLNAADEARNLTGPVKIRLRSVGYLQAEIEAFNERLATHQ